MFAREAPPPSGWCRTQPMRRTSSCTAPFAPVALWAGTSTSGRPLPYLGSVTRHFYEAGWKGIDIEPLAEEAAELRRARPRDVVIEAALGSTGRRGHPLCRGRRAGASRAQTRRWERAISEPAARCESERSDRSRWQRSWTSTATERSPSSKSTWRARSPKCCRETTGSRWRPRVVVVEATNPWSYQQTHTRAGSHSCWQLVTCSLPSTGSTGSTPRSEEPDLLTPARAGERARQLRF